MAIVNAAALADGLRRLGVQPGMALEVHCSLSRFGYVEGGADTVIGSLIKAVGSAGAVVMPAFRLTTALPLTEEDRALGLTSKIQILPENQEHSAMGAVADRFRQRPDVHTGDGIFRVCAWGKDAKRHAEGFQRIIDHGGFALLLGVDIYSLSAMHYVEDALPEEIRRRFRPSEAALRQYPEDQWLTEAWAPDGKPWYEIQDQAFTSGLITHTEIGTAKCLFFPVRPVIGLYRKALQERPLELYGLG